MANINGQVNAGADVELQVGAPERWNPVNISRQDLLEEPENKFFVKVPKRRKLIIVFILFIILSLCLSLILGLLFIRRVKDYDVCQSKECYRTASSLLELIDTDVEPCDNFHKFACGRWSVVHPLPNNTPSSDWITEASDRKYKTIAEYLSRHNKATDPPHLIKARTMYKACMDTDSIERLGLNPIGQLLANLRLPAVPPLSDAEFHDLNLNIGTLLASAKTIIGSDIIFFSNIFSLADNSRKVIALSEPKVESLIPSLSVFNEEFPSELLILENIQTGEPKVITSLGTYGDFLYEVINNMVNTFYRGINYEKTQLSREIYNNLRDIYNNITETMREAVRNSNLEERSVFLNITELQNMTDSAAEEHNLKSKIDWLQYMGTLFENANLSINITDEMYYVASPSYYKAISVVLAKHSDYEIGIYIWFKIVSGLIPYSTKAMQMARDKLLSRLHFQHLVSESRSIECGKGVGEIMTSALIHGAHEEINSKKLKSEVDKMITNILNSTINFITASDWVDEETTLKIIDKTMDIKRVIGYSESMIEEKELERIYGQLNVSEDTHMMNFINIVQIKLYHKLNDFYNKSRDHFSDINFSPVETNAAYMPGINALMIPLGILQFPFYNLGIDALNYGAIGSIIGHELTHSFDTTGSMFNKNGSISAWWTNETTMNYLKQVQCFIQQYSIYSFSKYEKVDGNLTLDENIADNGGLKDAFYGYRNAKKEKGGKEIRLPGLEKYSQDQLFFLSFAHVWCDHVTPETLTALLKVDNHSPKSVRIVGTLSNSEEFAKAWSCPADSKMNPTKKCLLW